VDVAAHPEAIHEVSPAQVLSELGLVDLGPRGAATSVLADGVTAKPLARVYLLNQGNSIQTVCLLHGRCKLWVNVRPGDTVSVLCDSYRWARFGCTCAAEAHGQEGRRIKLAHGTRVR